MNSVILARLRESVSSDRITAHGSKIIQLVEQYDGVVVTEQAFDSLRLGAMGDPNAWHWHTVSTVEAEGESALRFVFAIVNSNRSGRTRFRTSVVLPLSLVAGLEVDVWDFVTKSYNQMERYMHGQKLTRVLIRTSSSVQVEIVTDNLFAANAVSQPYSVKTVILPFADYDKAVQVAKDIKSLAEACC